MRASPSTHVTQNLAPKCCRVVLPQRALSGRQGSRTNFCVEGLFLDCHLPVSRRTHVRSSTTFVPNPGFGGRAWARRLDTRKQVLEVPACGPKGDCHTRPEGG